MPVFDEISQFKLRSSFSTTIRFMASKQLVEFLTDLINVLFYQSWVKLHFWDTCKKQYRNFFQTSILTVRNLARGFVQKK